MAGKGSTRTVKIGEKEFHLLFTTSALARLEEKLGMEIPEIVRKLESGEVGFRVVTAMLWAGITGFEVKQYGRVRTGYEKLCNIIDENGGLVNVMTDLLRAFSAAQGEFDPEDPEKNSKAASESQESTS